MDLEMGNWGHIHPYKWGYNWFSGAQTYISTFHSQLKYLQLAIYFQPFTRGPCKAPNDPLATTPNLPRLPPPTPWQKDLSESQINWSVMDIFVHKCLSDASPFWEVNTTKPLDLWQLYELLVIPGTYLPFVFGGLNPSKQGLFQSKQGSFGF